MHHKQTALNINDDQQYSRNNSYTTLFNIYIYIKFGLVHVGQNIQGEGLFRFDKLSRSRLYNILTSTLVVNTTGSSELRIDQSISVAKSTIHRLFKLCNNVYVNKREQCDKLHFIFKYLFGFYKTKNPMYQTQKIYIQEMNALGHIVVHR